MPLLSTGTSIIGETIRYPKTGRSRVTAAIVTLAPGGRTIVHKHGVPLFAYILDGELTRSGLRQARQAHLPQGTNLHGAMNAPHVGINTGSEPVRLLAVYMGARAQHAKDVIPLL